MYFAPSHFPPSNEGKVKLRESNTNKETSGKMRLALFCVHEIAVSGNS